MENVKIITNLLKLKSNLFSQDGGEPTALKNWVIVFTALGMTAFLIQINQGAPETQDEVREAETFDTFVPEGMSLIPIQVANYESLDQIIGQYGVVDLITKPVNPLKKPKKVAWAVKLVRSSAKPNGFSVLVPEGEVVKIVRHGELFTVSVRNPKSIGTKFVKKKRKSVSRIIYDSE